MSLTLAEFRGVLENHHCHPRGDRVIKARCPAHDDHDPSLEATLGNNGGVVVKCFAGCSFEDITDALGLPKGALSPTREIRGGKPNIVATYDYTDEAGKLLFQVCRLDPKDFLQRKPNGNGGWTWKVSGIRQVPFHLPELLAAVKAGRPVYIAEGEKDVLALEAAGFVATCNAGGALKWRRDFAPFFNGAEVVIIADKDTPGRKHAADVAAKLKDSPASVKILELPDVNGTLVKDAADFFAAGGQPAELDAITDPAPKADTTAPTAQPADSPTFEAITADLRGQMVETLTDGNIPGPQKKQALADLVVANLVRVGRLFFHAELRDFESAMFFDSFAKRLLRIRADAFTAWLSDWIKVNRADPMFKHVQAQVETAALSGQQTTGILPEAFWAVRSGAIYLSNGDGAAAKITPGGVTMVDNGADGVLFAAGRTLAPWKLTAPQDPFETCSLFRCAHTAAGHGPVLVRLWLYSLPTNPRSKPLLCLEGEIGSGKTRLAKGFAELLGLTFVAHKVEESAESDFWPCCDAGGIFVLDNADTRCKWLADALANAATDGCSQRRKLYTNSETVILRARAWLVMTTANPTFASDSGLADRLILCRMNRRDEETSDAALTDEILAARNGGLSHLAQTLRGALADQSPVAPGLNARHPDFAAFAVRIGRALGMEAEAIAALRNAEADKAAFCLENDQIGAALLAYLADAGSFTGTAADLAPHLTQFDPELAERLSAKRLAKRLGALWPHLEKKLSKAKRETDRKGFLVFTLQMARPADFADFEMPFR